MSVALRDLLIAVANLVTALFVLGAVLSGVPLDQSSDVVAMAVVE